jgi:hypothetical protein
MLLKIHPRIFDLNVLTRQNPSSISQLDVFSHWRVKLRPSYLFPGRDQSWKAWILVLRVPGWPVSRS